MRYVAANKCVDVLTHLTDEEVEAQAFKDVFSQLLTSGFRI